jgi:hypothetical protein
MLAMLLALLAVPSFAQTVYSITPNSAPVFESGGSVTFTIKRSGSLPAETVYASTTQTEGFSNNGDYSDFTNQAVSFILGQTNGSVTVTILDDSIVESSETFGFIVQRDTTDPVSTYLAKSTFTIVNDDVPTIYSISNPTVVSESGGSNTFIINRSGGLPAETIYASTTETEGYVNSGDYVGMVIQAVSFSSGQITSTANVTILNDFAVETNETFGFIVQRQTNDPASTYLAKSTFTIVDEDVPTTYSISNPTVVSESGGSNTFTINRSGGLPAETIYASTTETEGYVNSGDYVGMVNQVVSFSSGQITSSANVTILNDFAVEANETFGFIVQRQTNDPASTYLAKSTFTIVDDDVPPQAPVLSASQRSGTTFTVSATTEGGHTYTLQGKSSFTQDWVDIETKSGTGGQIILTDTNATAFSKIYWVRVQ